MKTISIYCSLIFIFFSIYSYCQPKALSMKKIEKNFIKINDTIYVNKYETSNELYNLFLSKQIKNDSNYSLLEIDSINWILPEYMEAPLVELYQLHPAYLNYPVVNISYEGATLFCKWLTECYNNFPKRKYNKVEICLPSKEEWDLFYFYAASKKNYKQIKYSVSPIDTYKEKYSFYNILGSVKEMTSTKGLAKGGDWKNGIDLLKLDYYYNEKSTPFIGFRFFIVIKEK